uniref:KorA-like protein n=1 Tax=Rhizobium meliloti TaxID=382 RepID=Q5BTP0_RHIML|nr:KorA-like protein [Sinorhizobium meliloti]
MTKRDFEAAVKRLQISERGIDMARRVLVGGEAQSLVATDYGVTLGAVTHQVSRVWRTYVDALEVPPDHERVSAVLPKDKAEIVRTWERDSRRNR